MCCSSGEHLPTPTWGKSTGAQTAAPRRSACRQTTQTPPSLPTPILGTGNSGKQGDVSLSSSALPDTVRETRYVYWLPFPSCPYSTSPLLDKSLPKMRIPIPCRHPKTTAVTKQTGLGPKPFSSIEVLQPGCTYVTEIKNPTIRHQKNPTPLSNKILYNSQPWIS